MTDHIEPRLRVAVLYDQRSMYTNTVSDYVRALEGSRHDVFLLPATPNRPSLPQHVDLSAFDAVLVHYSVRFCFDHVIPAFRRALREFPGFKALCVQDEYDLTERTRAAIEDLGIGLVFTCVPERWVHTVYPAARFPTTRFVSVLTGYVAPWMETLEPTTPTADREVLIGYRGRDLPVWYGALAEQKSEIGRLTRAACDARGLRTDIEWDDSHRIYGDAWISWLSNCRATLGTESGANVFDDAGHIRTAVMARQRRTPTTTRAQLYTRYVEPFDNVVRMNQVSPRVFEAAACRTALVLTEGEYSGIVLPDTHYIPIKSDASNIDEVIDALRDVDSLRAMVDRTWSDLIGSGRYPYSRFIELVDDSLSEGAAGNEHRRASVRILATANGNFWESDVSFGATPPVPPAPRGARLTQRVRRRAVAALARRRTALAPILFRIGDKVVPRLRTHPRAYDLSRRAFRRALRAFRPR